MIPATIADVARPRPVSHGSITDQEYRVGLMLIAQELIAIRAELRALAAVQAEAPKPVKAARAPRAPKPPPESAPPPAPAPVEPPAPAPPPKVAPAPTVTVPADVSRTAQQAYLDGYAAALVGEARATNPHQGTRGIPAGRRIAWDRGFDDGRAA